MPPCKAGVSGYLSPGTLGVLKAMTGEGNTTSLAERMPTEESMVGPMLTGLGSATPLGGFRNRPLETS